MVKIEHEKTCSCCSETANRQTDGFSGAYICYCSKVTEEDIREAILTKGASSVAEVIRMTGAMTHSNCRVNNPKGTCCYPDIEAVFRKYREKQG